MQTRCEVYIKAFAGKRVLMLLENNPYPQDPRPRREARALREAGYKVSIICPAVAQQAWHQCVDGVDVYRYPGPPAPAGVWGYLWEYSYSMVATFVLSWVVFFRNGFDIIHAHNPPDTFVLVAAPFRVLGKRFIFDHHDLSPEMYRARFQGGGNHFIHKALLWAEKLSCRMADRVIATNESYKIVEMERDKVPAYRIAVVRNGPDGCGGVPEPDPSLRRMEKTIIGYVGVMGHQDGVDYLLRALSHLITNFKRTDFLCVIIGGRGEARDALKLLCSELGLEDYVWFTGWVSDEDLSRYLAAADICVDPDPSNPFNDRSTMIKMMEYMALAKPIVAFDLPEHRFTAQRAAVYVRPNDEMEFAAALNQLMDDPETQSEMGDFGWQRVQTDLAWHHSARQLLAVYQSLVHEYSGRLSRRQQIQSWVRKRSAGYMAARLFSLMRRYGVRTTKAEERIRECVSFFREKCCPPTFPTPGRIVERNPEFCREIQSLGAEFAVHGYDHVDFLSLTDAEAKRQLTQAAAAFQSAGIRFSGLRCPYLSYSDRLLDLFPGPKLEYSSNKAILWNVVPEALQLNATQLFANLDSFYRPISADSILSMPAVAGDIVEIPVSLPDDLQLYDGLKLRDGDMAKPWMEILQRTHQTGQLFVLMFHPELFSECKRAFEILLSKVMTLTPSVWIAQLREISNWWREKKQFAVHRHACNGRLRLDFECSDRATLLVRGLACEDPSTPWNGKYLRLTSRSISVSAAKLPFVGLPGTTPPTKVSFLEQQGYLVDLSERASQCGIYLDCETLTRLDSQPKLIDYIENSEAPLVRMWPWPDGHKSALSITGDLDALSLRDYTARVFT